jgi:hypothetical protein
VPPPYSSFVSRIAFYHGFVPSVFGSVIYCGPYLGVGGITVPQFVASDVPASGKDPPYFVKFWSSFYILLKSLTVFICFSFILFSHTTFHITCRFRRAFVRIQIPVLFCFVSVSVLFCSCSVFGFGFGFVSGWRGRHHIQRGAHGVVVLLHLIT